MAEFRKCKILCWDEHQLLPGSTRDLQFSYACEEADYIFILLSSGSVQKENLFQKLIKKALSAAEEKPEGSIKIIPICLDNCGIPSSLRELYHVDLWEENAMLRLVVTAMENEWKRRTIADDWKYISYNCLWE